MNRIFTLIVLVTPLAAADLQCPPASDRSLRDASAHLDAARFHDAEVLLEPLTNAYPECPSVIASQGRLEVSRRNYDRANALSERAVALDPNDSNAMALRGRMLAMQGRESEGRAILERAVQMDPANAEAFFQLGSIYDRAKRHPEAVAAFKKVVSLRPSDPRAWDYLALHLEPLGWIDEAEDSYRRGIAVNRKPLFDYFLDYNYGRFLLKKNKLAESKAHLDRALELVPQLRATHYDHAKLNLRLGEFSESRKDAEAALAIPDPNGLILDLQVYTLLAAIWNRLGDRAQAARYAALSESAKVPLRTDRSR